MAAMTAVPAEAQMYWHDPDKRNQFASMEFMQWHFTPESYYYSWYTKKIDLGLFTLKIRMPGTGKHDRGPAGILPILGDNYVNEQWRMMSPLRAATTAEAVIAKGNRRETQEQWNKTMQDDALELADNTLDISYSSAKDDIEKGRKAIAEMSDNLTLGDLAEVEEELLAIRQAVEYIHDSGMPNARKTLGYDRQLRALDDLKKKVRSRSVLRYTEDARKGKEAAIW